MPPMSRGAVACLGLGWLIGGLPGVLIWLGLASYATIATDPVGLRPALRADARPPAQWPVREPAGPAHSWNAPQWYSSAMMLNAPRHSDHHENPMRAFPALDLGRPDHAHAATDPCP